MIPIPNTEYKDELINNGTPKHVNFLNSIFTDQVIALPFSLFWWCDINNKFLFSRNELYDFYVKWCGPKHNVISISVFGKELSKQKRVSDGEKKTSNKIRHLYSFLDPDFYSTTISPICGPNYLLISGPKKPLPP